MYRNSIFILLPITQQLRPSEYVAFVSQHSGIMQPGTLILLTHVFCPASLKGTHEDPKEHTQRE